MTARGFGWDPESLERAEKRAACTPPPPDTPFDMSAPALPGYRWELQTEEGWRLATDEEKASRRCRRHGCPNAPAAALDRGRRHGTNWWLYCADHMYGRVIVDGVVMSRRAIPLDQSHPREPEAILADLRELAARPDDGAPMRFLPADAREILHLLGTRKETT